MRRINKRGRKNRVGTVFCDKIDFLLYSSLFIRCVTKITIKAAILFIIIKAF